MRPAYQYSVYTTHERRAMAAHLRARRAYKRILGENAKWLLTPEQIKRLEGICKIQCDAPKE